MPGIGMRLCVAQRQEMRQCLTLQQRLEQRMVLAQVIALRIDLMDEDVREVLYERYYLENLAKKIDYDQFLTIGEFVNFLDRQSLKKEIKPEIKGRVEITDKQKNKIRLPELAKILRQIADFWYFAIRDSDPEKDPMSFITDMLLICLGICHMNNSPTNVWKYFFKAIPKNEIDTNPKFIINFWQILLNNGNNSYDLSSIFSLTKFAHKHLDIVSLSDYLNFTDKEAAGLDSAYTYAYSNLTGIEKKLSTLQDYKLISQILFQILRYRTGSRYEISFNSFAYEKLLENERLIQNLNQLEHLPQAVAFMIFDRFKFEEKDAFEKIKVLEELAGQKYIKKSRDAKRILLRGIYAFGSVAQPEKSFEIFLSLANNAKNLIHGLQAIERKTNQLLSRDKISIPWQSNDMEGFISKLDKGSRSMYKKILGFNDDEVTMLMDPEVWKRMSRNDLLTKGLIFTNLCHINQCEKGAELIAETMRQALYKRFLNWRYSSFNAGYEGADFVQSQAWKNNHHKTILIGMTDEIKQKIGSIRQIARSLAQNWQKTIGYSVTAANLDAEYQETTALLRDKTIPEEKRKKLGVMAGQIKKDYGFVQTIKAMLKLDEQNFNLIKDSQHLLKQMSDRLNNEEATMLIQQLINIINDTNFNAVSRVSFVESDKPYDTIRVGKDPVLTCQRWHEWGSMNHCLPAYVVDANKKVLWVKDQFDRIIARSIIRLIPIEFGRKEPETIPLLIIERPYSIGWTEQIAMGMLQWFLEKADQISSEEETAVMLGVKDEQFIRILKKVIPKTKIKTRHLRIKMPPSLNDYEYSDVLGGQIKSGKTVNATLTTFFVGNK